jgi:uncharacterized membrane protein (UPF0127 family)
VRIIQVSNAERETVLADQVQVADRWWPRLRGLIGQPEPEPGEGLLIEPSQGVHMYWMKYAIDVALIDKEKRVVAVYSDLQPGKRTKMHWSAQYALELRTGVLGESGTEVGDQLAWAESGREAA